MKLLHLDSAITGDNSISRKLSASIVAHLTAANPGLTITYRDLVAAPIDHLTLSVMPTPGASTATLDEFLDTDIVVIGAPMYNFTVPTQLKAWIDRILVAGKTFRYGEAGPTGLAGDKRVIIAVTRGGLYGADTPAAGAEHLETYLSTVFGFIGVVPEFIIAEGMLLGPVQLEAAIAHAHQKVSEIFV